MWPPVSSGCFHFFAMLLFCFLCTLSQACIDKSVRPSFFKYSIYPHTLHKEFLLMHGHHNFYFKLHVHGCINLLKAACGHALRFCTPDLDMKKNCWYKQVKDYIIIYVFFSLKKSRLKKIYDLNYLLCILSLNLSLEQFMVYLRE